MRNWIVVVITEVGKDLISSMLGWLFPLSNYPRSTEIVVIATG